MFRLLIIAALCLASTPLPASSRLTRDGRSANQTPKPVFSTPEQLQADIEAVPCKSNAERLKAVKVLFEKMGASASDISIENKNSVANIIVRKQGSSPEIVVIGAHYDKVSHGCGAVDNWTGIVTIAHIYRTIKDVPLKKTLLFVGFGREEEGLIGSREMVKSIPKDQLSQHCAMINIDSLGMGIPQVDNQISSKKLIARAAVLAERMKMPFHQGSISGTDTDSSSFLARKIPAISLHGLSNKWREVLHTNNDKVSKVNTTSVFLGYTLALGLVGEIENAACDAFR